MIDKIVNLNPIFLSLIATTFTWSITGLGASLVFFFKKINRNIMDAMLGFAAGVMIAASFWSLLSPGISLAEELDKCAFLIAAIGFMTGGIILYIGDKICKYFMNKYQKENKEGLREGRRRFWVWGLWRQFWLRWEAGGLRAGLLATVRRALSGRLWPSA